MEYKREPLEEDEVLALRRICKTFDEELCINVLLETGMRVSELANLREDQISWQRSCITTIGKGGRRRVIPMSNLARHYLTECFTKGNSHFPLACRTIQKYVKVVADRARIMKPVSPHVLRHTFAVQYLHKGGNIRALQEILGHSSLLTTDIYLNYSGQRVIEDFQRVWGTKTSSWAGQKRMDDFMEV
ncbi:tyrosine-type recombinase/integrase [Candidatus Woesearchaeota archaeon]|nr:tyrosine-type recombinase/integrase [Candidatus Woesearchaeota archaeon]